MLADGRATTPTEADAAALEEIKAAHERAPKYDLSEESEATFLARTNVKIDEMRALVLKGGLVALGADQTCSVEEYVAAQLRARGYQTLFCESSPFHALFAVLLWGVIQDPNDPLVRTVHFGERVSFEQYGRSSRDIATGLPEDFGSETYSIRRSEAIREAFATRLSGDRDRLLNAFDSGVVNSAELRQYLWAHRDGDLQRARTLISVLGPDQVRACLKHLVHNYWAKYLGWPDLLAWREEEVLFVEVKLSRDKLSDEQRAWIEDNQKTLHLPFTLVKVHRLAKAG
jgi:hypothetical protein